MNRASEDFRTILLSQGVQASLAYLNSKAPHRYTGLFSFHPPELRNIALADAWDSKAALMSGAPLQETFFGFVRASGTAFQTSDGHTDPRLSGHRLAMNPVQSYCGVLLFHADGTPRGTLCHFDTRPCDLGHQALELLESAASLIRHSKLLDVSD